MQTLVRTSIPLGVLLYELLTGTTPFPENRLRSAACLEMQRIIAEEEPERPSTRQKKMARCGLAPERDILPASLPVDLDWIVIKCLEKDRGRRYETADGLARDIQRHLSNEAVQSRPPSASYQLGRFVRRHKLPFAAASFSIAALLAAVAPSTWQAIRAHQCQHYPGFEDIRQNNHGQSGCLRRG